ncbi:HpcH/HpaI aldolase family protein [Ferdinandcohnia sp. Marseille-Q9671]
MLKQKLKNNELTLGSWITLGHSSIAEIMSQAGFEWLVVDMEHSVISLSDAQSLIQVIELSGVTPLVRVGVNDANLIKRVMDTGAHGVIVPLVNTKEEAEKAVESVKYPPLGTRGVGLARATKYGANFEGYKKWVNEESIVIVQIEHIDGVNNLEEILSVEGVDGFIIGPYDLSGSLGVPGQFDHPSVIEALDRVKSISKRMGKTAGFHVVPTNEDSTLEKIKEGYNFIAYSIDELFLGDRCREGLSKIKQGL